MTFDWLGNKIETKKFTTIQFNWNAIFKRRKKNRKLVVTLANGGPGVSLTIELEKLVCLLVGLRRK